MDFLKNIPNSDAATQVSFLLNHLAVPSHLKGYEYLHSAIIMTLEAGGNIQSGLSDAVAKKYGTTKTLVDQAMHKAIGIAWDNCDIDILNSCFGYTIDSCRCRPTPKEFISILADYICLKAENDPLKIMVTESLHTFGVPANILGYHYLRTAIILTVKDPDMIINITKRMYKEVASKHRTSLGCVDRSIRKAIEISWNRADINAWRSYFGYTISNIPHRPTSSEFIAMVADDIRLRVRLISPTV